VPLFLEVSFNVQCSTMLHSGSNVQHTWHRRNLLIHDTRSITDLYARSGYYLQQGGTRGICVFKTQLQPKTSSAPTTVVIEDRISWHQLTSRSNHLGGVGSNDTGEDLFRIISVSVCMAAKIEQLTLQILTRCDC
jgi:hypothetical protein